ncbi:metallophosphoesterase [Segeticoccus rhizosphaerae]|uniref:metallophosphoesterase n=1 Tax=Segeticoccus rhizosphaerae TaxID=1104777 RepID=UPI00126469D3|nr:metallophosphoesterase [Segeticoccus rhizosphaerae]
MPTSSARYAISDVHGHRDQMLAALATAGLVDGEGDWAGGEASLWCLGDFFDRGPDGVGVVEAVMRLQTQAQEAGGHVGALLGNHEVLALGMRDFRDAPVAGGVAERPSFANSWLINGGQPQDQDRLQPAHLDWLRALPAVVRDDDDLLLHSDTLAYLEWGAGLEEINAGVRASLTEDDLTARWTCWARMTTRFAFNGPEGEQEADALLGALGGTRIVHGHSPITVLTGVPPHAVTEPYSYAGGRALGIDGGLFAGGPCLVVPLER